jgi:DNA-binding winged helix-turn-helix (wHTH) protein/tetratricopeptide (TPR) repeat protein
MFALPDCRRGQRTEKYYVPAGGIYDFGMQMQDSEPGRKCEAYRFDCFEASLMRGDLLQRGERLRVQDLPFKMLVALLEKPGELVTKEELARQLWGQDVFTDIDQSLYVIVKKLRRVLGDNATEPRYVKTVSGRGYKFIESVTPVFTPAAEIIPLSHLSPMQAGSTLREAFPGAPRLMRTTDRKLLLAGLVLTLAGATVALSIYIYRYERRPLMNDRDKVVVAAFTNNTGSVDLDQTLWPAIESQLQESPYLNLVPEQTYRAMVKNLDSPSLQQELRACVALDGQVMIKGGISAVGQGYRITLAAWKCASGKLLTTEKADADSQATILAALDLTTERMRRRLGESEASLKKFNVPAELATTASLAALKAFNYGDEMRFKDDTSAATASYKLAIDLDPQFAIAYARLGTIYHNTEQFALSREFYQRAFELRSSRSSDREKLYIVAHYYEFATGQTQRAIEIYELWHSLYPRDPVPIDNLENEYLLAGRPQQTLNAIQQVAQLEPENRAGYIRRIQTYVRLGDYASVRKACEGAAQQHTDSLDLHRACYEVAFAQNDEVAMQKALQMSHGDTAGWVAIADTAWAAMYHGKSSEAAAIFRKAEQIALQEKSIETAADLGLDRAMLEAEVGLLPAARTDAETVLKLPFASAGEQAYAALALARAGGETSLANSAMGQAERIAPLDDVVNVAMFPTTRAAAFLRRDDPGDALQALEKTRVFDLYGSMQMVPDYYRGLAYLQKKQPEFAVREFQHIIDNKYLLPTFSIYLVLTQLELGHAYQLLGDSKSANSCFAIVDLAWKNADHGFPPLQTLRKYRALSALSRWQPIADLSDDPKLR